MSAHKFRIGQMLDFTPDPRSAQSRSGKCKVVSLLPTESATPRYRVRCTNETFERAVWEDQLR
jgi:hypothetical protein